MNKCLNCGKSCSIHTHCLGCYLILRKARNARDKIIMTDQEIRQEYYDFISYHREG
jgi:hypothetical protein